MKSGGNAAPAAAYVNANVNVGGGRDVSTTSGNSTIRAAGRNNGSSNHVVVDIARERRERHDFVLGRELPDNPDEARDRARASLLLLDACASTGGGSGGSSSSQNSGKANSNGFNRNKGGAGRQKQLLGSGGELHGVSLVAQGEEEYRCTCPHLLEVLPDQLDLTFRRLPPNGGSSSGAGGAAAANRAAAAAAAAAASGSGGGFRSPSKKSSATQQHGGGGRSGASSNAASRSGSPGITGSGNATVRKQKQPARWVPTNPVHALHLASQLEEGSNGERYYCHPVGGAGSPKTGRKSAGSGAGSGGFGGSTGHISASALLDLQEPILYGEEQERLIAFQTFGFPESWHPWIRGGPGEEGLCAGTTWPNDNPPASTSSPSTPSRGGGRKRKQPPAPTAATSAKKNDSTAAAAADKEKKAGDDSSFAASTAAGKASATAGTTTKTESQPANPPPPPVTASSSAAAATAPGAEENARKPPSTTAAAAAASSSTTGEVVGPQSSDAAAKEAVSDKSGSKNDDKDNKTAAAIGAGAPSKNPSLHPAGAGGSTGGAAGAGAFPPTKLGTTAAAPAATTSGASSTAAATAATDAAGASEGPKPSAVALSSSGGNAVSAALPAPSTVASSAAAAAAKPSAAIPPKTTSAPAPSAADGGAATKLQVQLLPEERYSSLHTREENIRVLRKAMMSKRSVPAAAKKGKATAAAAAAAKAGGPAPKKRKTADTKAATSLVSLAAWKQLYQQETVSNKSKGGGGPVSKKKEAAAIALAKKKTMSAAEYEAWKEKGESARRKAELWMLHYRESRQIFWKEQQRQEQRRRLEESHSHAARIRSKLLPTSTFGVIHDDLSIAHDDGRYHQHGDYDYDDGCSRSCTHCRRLSSSVGGTVSSRIWSSNPNVVLATGDDLFHCLECDFVGCGPSWAVGNGGKSSNEHIVQHLLVSNHNFAVSCGIQAKVYCFKCGDFVQQQIFQQEKERLDIAEKLPWLGWKEHPVMRSFDALRFMRVLDHGIVWRGMTATYPPLVPTYHVKAARLSMMRLSLLEGRISYLPESASPEERDFAVSQSKKGKRDRLGIPAPVGMYNLGNTCFMSSILQCLVHCIPVQRYFLPDMGHGHQSCQVYRDRAALEGKPSNGKAGGAAKSAKKETAKNESICLGCELDKLMLQYFGSSNGIDMSCIAVDASIDSSNVPVVKGEPLVTAEMLTAAWKCSGMSHLAGYEQRDAHEFLHGFFDILGKHLRQYRESVRHAISIPHPSNAIISEKTDSEKDVIKKLFEGTLRSVLLCRKCGNKRVQTEKFMSLSLPLSKEVQKLTTEATAKGSSSRGSLSVERCLRHFTMPEALADNVDCPSCGEKTPTTKQHVISRLPRVLCLHLKRFDAALNRKIEDYVSFPANALNMGPYLPHWTEIRRGEQPNASSPLALPSIKYDLFGTVNHFGNLQSGHYVSNVKVDSQWYHINDAHVSYAGNSDNGESSVVNSEGAYLLFYIRS